MTSDPVPLNLTREQYAELVRLATEGFTIPVEVGGRVVFHVVPAQQSSLDASRRVQAMPSGK